MWRFLQELYTRVLLAADAPLHYISKYVLNVRCILGIDARRTVCRVTFDLRHEVARSSNAEYLCRCCRKKHVTRALIAYLTVHLSVNSMLIMRKVSQSNSYLPPSVLTSHHTARWFQMCIHEDKTKRWLLIPMESVHCQSYFEVYTRSAGV